MSALFDDNTITSLNNEEIATVSGGCKGTSGCIELPSCKDLSNFFAKVSDYITENKGDGCFSNITISFCSWNNK